MASPADASGNVHVHSLIYGTFLKALPDGTYEPNLAESVEVLDPQTLVIHIRDGVQFSDGTPFDAEAVQFGLRRNRDANNSAAFATELKLLESVIIEDPLTVRLKLERPASGAFYPLLTRGETMIVSPTAVQQGVDLRRSPVGAGPFLLESVEVDRWIRLVKNPNYWNADNVRLARVEIIHAGSPQAITNALISKNVDFADNISSLQAPILDGQGLDIDIRVLESNLFWGALCKRHPPFDDVRVRRALNLALDREWFNRVLFEGKSEPMWGLHTAASPYRDPALEGYFARDLGRARELLAEAGYPNGFEMDIMANAEGGVEVTAAELAHSQFGDIGIRVRIVPTAHRIVDFFLGNRAPLMFLNMQRGGLDRVTRTLVPGSMGNVCNWNDPRINALVDELRAVAPDSEDAIRLWRRLDRHLLETAANVFVVFGTSGTAVNPDRVGGVRHVLNFTGTPHLEVESAYIRR
jgi:peptide/nickel transport system substrate-binding protein